MDKLKNLLKAHFRKGNPYVSIKELNLNPPQHCLFGLSIFKPYLANHFNTYLFTFSIKIDFVYIILRYFVSKLVPLCKNKKKSKKEMFIHTRHHRHRCRVKNIAITSCCDVKVILKSNQTMSHENHNTWLKHFDIHAYTIYTCVRTFLHVICW